MVKSLKTHLKKEYKKTEKAIEKARFEEVDALVYKLKVIEDIAKENYIVL